MTREEVLLAKSDAKGQPRTESFKLDERRLKRTTKTSRARLNLVDGRSAALEFCCLFAKRVS
jgi:hypothetical protein